MTDTERAAALLRDQATWGDPPSADFLDVVAPAPGENAMMNARLSTGEPIRGWSGSQILSAAAVIAAVVMLVGAGLMVAGRFADQPEVAATMLGTDLSPRAIAELSIDDTPSGARIELDISGLAPAAPGTYYQGWVVTDAGPITIGTFHLRDDEGPVVLWAGVDSTRISRVTVTIQDEGAGAASSGRVVVAVDLN